MSIWKDESFVSKYSETFCDVDGSTSLISKLPYLLNRTNDKCLGKVYSKVTIEIYYKIGIKRYSKMLDKEMIIYRKQTPRFINEKIIVLNKTKVKIDC